jgi:hypothetical protein
LLEVVEAKEAETPQSGSRELGIDSRKSNDNSGSDKLTLMKASGSLCSNAL